MIPLIQKYLKILNIQSVETLEDVSELIQAHLNNFSFSSVRVLLKEEISLELEDIYESIVLKRRGGYCFEHNKLFYEVLKALGFDVEFYLARVVNNLENEVPQTHRFTLLYLKGERYLIDVGIGFRSPNVPIAFSTSTTTSLGMTYEIKTFDNNTLALQLVGNHNFTVTTFDLNPCYEADCEMGHFYSHKHPCAVFVNNLVISIITGDEIRSLRNSDYVIIKKDKREKKMIRSLAHFTQILKEDLKVQLKADEVVFLYTNYVKNNQ